MLNFLEFQTLVACQKGLDKLKKQSDQGLLLFAILTSILLILALITKILFENRMRQVFGILEHLQ